MAKKYVVAKGVALTAKGIIYKPGEEIPEGVLTEESIQRLSAAKKIVEEKDGAQPEKPKDEKSKDEKPKDEKPKDEKPKDEKPKDEKPKDEK